MKKPRITARDRVLKMTVEGIIKKSIQNVEIPIFDLSKISDAGDEAMRDAVGKGSSDKDIEQAIKTAVDAAVAKYRKN